VLFLFNLSSTFRIISNSYFSEAQTLPPHRICPYSFQSFVAKKAVKRIFITIGAILQPFTTFENTLHSTPPKFIIISLTNHLIKFTLHYA
jgi:hypothetical protein